MQNHSDMRIPVFLRFVYPIVLRQIREVLRESGFAFREAGQGLEHCFWIKQGEKEIQFLLRNLLLEIATVDRDEQPLRFDTRLGDMHYTAAKSAKLVVSKLRILSSLLEQDDIEKAIDSIADKSGNYERIRIWRLDPEEQKNKAENRRQS